MSSVKDSWAKIKGEGIPFMTELFAKYPAYQNEFPKLKGKAAGALAGDAAMKEQACAVMNIIDACVKNGCDPGKIKGDVTALGKRHVQRGTDLGAMLNALDFFVEFAAKNGGDRGEWAKGVGNIKAALEASYQ